ncbi:Prenyltransferase and squalene oxidase repeat protein [Polystyrenella longa]|uniref:Prenyltransferase and squalene oxidase repeat protein n=1 Tax=Polystyrenella longa TaxID=2528007 RepID=A0A518CPY9_9PLAN|nr:DUF4159 domain-containing protein [Polystyrenella longa]QDU81290.1 Prenyltransferase and squalene oxidase repeat protein [Polystyrenella longa]
MFQTYISISRTILLAMSISICFLATGPLSAELTQAEVLSSIRQGTQFLFSKQNGDGSWGSAAMAVSHDDANIGTSSLVVLALLNCGLEPSEPHVKKGLEWIRNASNGRSTYTVSLKLMALAAAKQPEKDLTRMQLLASEIEAGQTNSGEWGYDLSPGNYADNSNTQFAVLALRDAVHAGARVDPETWEKTKTHFRETQFRDGSWGYRGRNGLGGGRTGYGSMTVAGISSYVISKSMIADEDKLKPDGTPDCCGNEEEEDTLERGVEWMARHFSVEANPANSGYFLFYYLYGLERAGRLSGIRFFGEHDWYREGARFLVARQSKQDGSWFPRQDYLNPVLNTSFCLLFLSKGLSPVLFNKLKYGRPDPVKPNEMMSDTWKRHDRDIHRLTDWITGLEKWPKLMSWQVVDINKAVSNNSVDDLLQAPILYISGDEPLNFPETHVKLLRRYLDQGGIIFATPSCDSDAFKTSFKELIAKIYEEEGLKLEPLAADHPVYRSEFLLHPETVDLQGVDYGCRTTILYCPDDLGCLWELWARNPPKGRTPKVTTMVTRATYIGANVAAYATGREPPKKQLDPIAIDTAANETKIERGLLQVAQLKHGGNWDTAPLALHNLLLALNEAAGLTAKTESPALSPQAEELERYPIVYTHGRSPFELSSSEITRLRRYLDNGGCLFADACCGSKQFDESFRKLVKQLYPEKELQRIPASHPLFTSQVGHDLDQVRRRQPPAGKNAGIDTSDVVIGEPFLESLEFNGRFPIIYSKYDISCALQKQSSISCSGYIPEDAARIGVNILLYALMQGFTFQENAE